MDHCAPRIVLLGVPVDCVDWRTATRCAEKLLDDQGGCKAVLAVNPEKIIAARDNPVLLEQLNEAALLLPDGIGAVIAARLSGERAIERVPGSEFMPALCEIAVRRGISVYLYGGRPEVNARAAAALQRMYPGLNIAGRSDGYSAADMAHSLVDSINESGASILFVALGSPKQELWIKQHGPRLKVKICQGVGGTFDVIAGEVKRAPALFRRCYLEWLYRLISNPTRARRQSALPKFAWLFLAERFAHLRKRP